MTDVETGYKAARSEIVKNMIIESGGFGFEIEFVAKGKKIDARFMKFRFPIMAEPMKRGKRLA